jgi:hypothetical protein
MILNDAAHEPGTAVNYLLLGIGSRQGITAAIAVGVSGRFAFAQQNGCTILTDDIDTTE